MYRNRQKSQHEINVEHWQEVTAWFMDGPGRLIKKVRSEKLSHDPNFDLSCYPIVPLSQEGSQEPSQTVFERISQGAFPLEPLQEVVPDAPLEPPQEVVPSPEAHPPEAHPPKAPQEVLETPSEASQKQQQQKPRQSKLKVISQDTFTAALNLKAEGYNPLLLNMANALNPGGGVYKGSMAQEEDLFRRSNYFQVTSVQDYYPLGEVEVIYSPNVTVYKTPEYTLLPQVTNLSCIACAAERDPRTIVNPEDPQNPFNRLYEDSRIAEVTKKRIETIFQVGLLKGHDSLVLGGLGCGAFNNPQMRIIEYFNEMLRIYQPFYKKIVFAVLSKRDPNFSLFSEFIVDPDAPPSNPKPKIKPILKIVPIRKTLKLPPPPLRGGYKRVTISQEDGFIEDSGHPNGLIGDIGHPNGLIGDIGHPNGLIGDIGHPNGLIGDIGYPPGIPIPNRPLLVKETTEEETTEEETTEVKETKLPEPILLPPGYYLDLSEQSLQIVDPYPPLAVSTFSADNIGSGLI